MTLEEVLSKLEITEKDLMKVYTVHHKKQKKDGSFETVIRKGDTYNNLTVYGIVSIRYGSNNICKYAICKCSCGNYTYGLVHNILNNNTKSCGCLVGECKERHGMADTRLYTIWNEMKSRCSPDHVNHKNYYDRGIYVCADWKKSFIAFKDWSLANGYTDELTIDRIDNDKGYSPDNCRWVDMQVQGNNKRNNRILEFNGEEKTLAEWCRDLGLNYSKAMKRIYRGWTELEALELIPRRKSS